MLGTRSPGARELPGTSLILEPAGRALRPRSVSTLTTRSTVARTAATHTWTTRRTTLGTPVEDWLSALNAGSVHARRRSCDNRRRRSFVNRARPGLGHHHLANLRYRCGGRAGFGLRIGNLRHMDFVRGRAARGCDSAIASGRRRSRCCDDIHNLFRLRNCDGNRTGRSAWLFGLNGNHGGRRRFRFSGNGLCRRTNRNRRGCRCNCGRRGGNRRLDHHGNLRRRSGHGGT
jgi:hypothetical protein